jgi:type IV pilus assembly protein PilE
MHTRTHSRRGFTLVELMAAVAIAGVLATISYPSIAGQLQRMRRVDAVVAVMAIQLAQERWRSSASAYASLAELGLPALSSGRHYTLQATAVGRDGYVVDAVATGTQQRDQACRYLRMTVSGADVAYTSGPDAGAANPDAANRRCWHR